MFNAQVLGTRRLMHIAFDEFEKVMSQCFDVFITWDDEYEKLQGLLRYFMHLEVQNIYNVCIAICF